jgi:Alw26I/Eco31I/Esp3I family type II restriction m6 adenine DNA methyltransferase
MNHLEILQSVPATQVGSGRDNLLVKTTGKFYTPKFIGERLVDTVLTLASRLQSDRKISIIDPFCGDGRLISWFLERASIYPEFLNRVWQIEIWDFDYEAVIQAEESIKKIAGSIGIEFTLSSSVHDSFDYFASQFKYAKDSKSKFDIAITNPPWEVVRPDRRDIAMLDKKTESVYVNALRDFSKSLEKNFPLSVPRKMFSGWGMNLARVGLEITIKLTKENGIAGIVSPASFLSDQNSETLRKWLLSNHTIKYIDYFPAEARLFDGVDQACSNLTIHVGRPKNKTFIYKFEKNLQYSEYHQELNLPEKFLESNAYIIPVSSNKSQLDILIRFSKLNTLGDLQGNEEGLLWTGRELDETGHSKFLSPLGKHPFLKGKMIERLTKVDQPSLFVHPEKGPSIPPSVKYPRLVWRDVSRPTQKRRVQATIIPKGWVTGNSLGVAHFWGNDLEKLYTLLGVISSLPFEFQVRSMLSTAHVSVGVLRKARIPLITSELSNALAPLVERKLRGDSNAEVEIEVVMAKAYGLNPTDLVEVMHSFPKLTVEERKYLIEHPRWNKP